ncbi:MAG TPA: C1 family peptidase [Saprospiraceae bacterium]|jgi:bleomycin hydrolase|nr:aminopeptidase [Saprospiraceae bacterium]HOJ89740.1 C1 family peptidase [Saprospiraceae bacterium]
MKKAWLILIYFVSLGLSFGQDNLVNSLKQNASDSAKKFKFTIKIDLEDSPVKNQGSSGTCWSYSGNSYLESEMLRMGKPFVDISEIYTARCAYIERAKNYVRMHGGIPWGDGAELHDVVQIYKKYGAMPYDAYTGLNYGTTKNKFGEMQAMIEGMLKAVVENKNGKLTPNWLPAIISVLDTYLGKVPEKFNYNGKQYTPQSFAKEVVGINGDDYIELGSFLYANNYEPTMLMVPDNWSLQPVYNVPMNEMSQIVDNALNKGYSIAWATDVSEKYFSWKNGVAIVPTKDFEDMTDEEKAKMFDGPMEERKITAQLREDAFDNYNTTDDHGMHIVGLAHDQNDKPYYIVKNSWGDKNDYKGYLFASKAFFDYKTIAILVHKDAIPQDIRKKLLK